MTDSRPIMTDEAFEQKAGFVEPHWWMAGESLIHLPAVMTIEGWSCYGSPGHMKLTPAQRTLMIWADIVGQVHNGGFEQFCYNYRYALAEGVAGVRALEWPELEERFCRAMAEQAGDADAPVHIQAIYPVEEPEKWANSRKRIVRHLARRGLRWWQPTRASSLAQIDKMFTDYRLQNEYIEAVRSGKMRSGGECYFDFRHPPTIEADVFDNWFYTEETKEASIRHVHRFIMKNRCQLYRIS